MESAVTQLIATKRLRFSKRWTKLNFEIRSMIAWQVRLRKTWFGEGSKFGSFVVFWPRNKMSGDIERRETREILMHGKKGATAEVLISLCFYPIPQSIAAGQGNQQVILGNCWDLGQCKRQESAHWHAILSSGWGSSSMQPWQSQWQWSPQSWEDAQSHVKTLGLCLSVSATSSTTKYF